MDVISADLRLYVLLAALLGAIVWNLITWYLGLPTSSSHALLGGYAGAGIAAYGGVSGLLKADVWFRTLKFIVLSPLVGMLMGFTLMVLVYCIFDALRQHASTKSSGVVNSSRQQHSRSAMVAMMHRRLWVLLPLFLRPEVFGAWSYNADGTLQEVPNYGCVGGTRRDCFGYALWWLAHRAHDGNEDHKLKPVGGFCAETAAAIDARLRHAHRNTCLHHPHHHGLDRRSRRHAQIIRSEMGHRRPNRLGLDSHDSRSGIGRRDFVLDRRGNSPPRELATKSTNGTGCPALTFGRCGCILRSKFGGG